MYLHLGQNTVILTEDIIGIFDLDTSTISKHTKNFLKKVQDNKSVINIQEDLPKSFILYCKKNTSKEKIYISQLSSQTLLKRKNKL